MRVFRLRSVVVVLICMLSARSLGAECIPLWQTLKDAEARSTLVFSGTVSESDDAILVSFNVERLWKGALKQHTTLVVMPGMEVYPASFFKPGKTYVVFASLTAFTTPPEITVVPAGTPIYEISFCSPTALVSDFGNSIEQLGPPKLPLPN